MSEASFVYVLDTSAWPTLIEDEAGADIVQDLLEKTGRGEVVVLASFMSFMEVYYITLQECERSEAQERVNLIAALPILRVESNRKLGLLAGEFKQGQHLSVVDAWIAALAKERDATLVHKDPEFEQVEAMIKVLKLPYKVCD